MDPDGKITGCKYRKTRDHPGTSSSHPNKDTDSLGWSYDLDVKCPPQAHLSNTSDGGLILEMRKLWEVGGSCSLGAGPW